MIAFLSLASAAVAYGDRVGIYSLQADGEWAERRRTDPHFTPHDFVLEAGSGRKCVYRCQKPGWL